MGYIILDTDRDDEMSVLRHNMRRAMRHSGTVPMMHNHEDYGHDKMYELGFKHGWEDAEDEHYRRARDSRGRYV